MAKKIPSKHPMQPAALDKDGVLRFKDNKIVRHLLNNGGIDLNQIACLEFSQEDREQFAQLIGYSVSGFGELSYVSTEAVETAENMHKLGMTEERARITYLQDELDGLKKGLRIPIARLYCKHPDDLKGPGDS